MAVEKYRFSSKIVDCEKRSNWSNEIHCSYENRASIGRNGCSSFLLLIHFGENPVWINSDCINSRQNIEKWHADNSPSCSSELFLTENLFERRLLINFMIIFFTILLLSWFVINRLWFEILKNQIVILIITFVNSFNHA